MGLWDRRLKAERIVEMGTFGLARYATLSNGETIWWGSDEDVPDQVALSAGLIAEPHRGGGPAQAGERAAA